MLLAIETSCDETAVALADRDLFLSKGVFDEEVLKAQIISSQVKLHSAYGGVVPELASREHLKNLPLLVEQVLSGTKTKPRDISAIAVTQGPGLKGCLLVGLCYAKTFALSRKIPLLSLNHIEGHLWAGFIGQNMPLPALALVVSGGHTQVVLIEGLGRYKIIANTKDDAAGEAFDKIASLLGLPYPGGPHLARLAESGDANAFKFPIGFSDDPSSFSFSGLKTAVQRTMQGLKILQETQSIASLQDLAASAEKAIVDALALKTKQAFKTVETQYFASPKAVRSLLLTGGVAANTKLRVAFQELADQMKVKLFVPKPEYCTDNAAMMACLALHKIRAKKDEYLNWQNLAQSALGPDAGFDVSAHPRFPITVSQ